MSGNQNGKSGLFWTPRGGNNAADIWASCHTFSSVCENAETGETERATVIVDMGQHEVPRDFAAGRFDKVVPALDDCLNVPGQDAPVTPAAAIFLTHCHSDHVAGVYEYLHMGAKLPAVYGSQHTLNVLKKGLIDNGFAPSQWPEMKMLHAGDAVKIGNMTVEAFPASHSVPGCFSFKISDPNGSIFHSGDTKADETSFLGRGVDLNACKKIGKNGGVDLMTFDATATHLKGHATYESEVFDTYKLLFQKHKDKQIVAVLPAAHMERLASVVSAAAAAGKNVIIDGGAFMAGNVMALPLSGYDLRGKHPDIQIADANGGLNPETSVTITTGIYMEPASPFIRRLTGQKSDFPLKKDAVVITPTSGDKNEKLQFFLKKEQFSGLTVVTGDQYPRLYGSGHAQADDFVKIANNIAPRTVAPIHCSREKADVLNALATRYGFQTLPDYPHNGSTVAVDRQGCRIVSEKSPNWFGLTHGRNADGSTATTFVKTTDNGYSCPVGKDLLTLRQQRASQKIADWRRKHARPVSLIDRRKHER